MKIWASGKVTRVADGLTDKRSARAKKILPAGALLWAWDADPQYDEAAGEQWLVCCSRRSGTSKQVAYSWRYDPCELAGSTAQNRARRAPRAPHVEECVTDDEAIEMDED